MDLGEAEDKSGTTISGVWGKFPILESDSEGVVGSLRRNGRRLPNVNPTPSGVGGGWFKDTVRLLLPVVVVRPGTSSCSPFSSKVNPRSSSRTSCSCKPSSAMAVCGSDPGRGKKTERFRECNREWRRAWLEGGGGKPGEEVEVGLVAVSRAEWDVGKRVV